MKLQETGERLCSRGTRWGCAERLQGEKNGEGLNSLPRVSLRLGQAALHEQAAPKSLWIKLKAHHGVLVGSLLQVVPLQDLADGIATPWSCVLHCIEGKGYCYISHCLLKLRGDGTNIPLSTGYWPKEMCFASSNAKDTQMRSCHELERSQKYLVITSTNHNHKGFFCAKICNILNFPSSILHEIF